MLRNFFESIKNYSEVIKIFFAIVAALYAGFQYHDRVINTKIERALKYKQQYSEENVYEARKKLASLWLQPEQIAFLKSYREGKIKDEEVMKVANRLVKENHLELSIYTLQSFYMDISTCVSNSVCDHDTACELFGKEIDNFRIFYMDYLDEWEDAWKIGVWQTVRDFAWSCEGIIKKADKRD